MSTDTDVSTSTPLQRSPLGNQIADTLRRDVIGDPGFILCPRGVALPRGGYDFDAHFGAEVSQHHSGDRRGR